MNVRLLFALLSLAVSLEAQQADSSRLAASAGKRFEAAPLFRLFFGSHWRDVWSQQIFLPLFRLGEGLHVRGTKEIGHVPSLILERSDGGQFLFRPVARDVRYLLPEELRETVAREIVEDQASAANPYAALVTESLARALELRTHPLQLTILAPDDLPESLRTAFTAIPGTLEDYDENGIISTDSLLRRLSTFPDESLDELEYLKHRLFDILVGEWDRTPAEWQWKKRSRESSRSWIPHPSPRDRAFSRFDGLFPSLAQLAVPKFSHIDETYGNIEGLTSTARQLDRGILNSHEKQSWDSVTAWMKSRLSDSLIESAVRGLPPEIFTADGAALIRVLKSRRNGLDKAAKELYKICSEFIEINAAAGGETIRVQRVGTHLLSLERWSRDSIPRKLFSRRFSEDYTKEIRLRLGGSGSTVNVEGSEESNIKLIIVSGNTDTVRESSSARIGLSLNPFRAASTVVYAASGRPQVKLGRNSKLVLSLPEMEGAPEDDYGSAWKFVPWFGATPDEGLFLGGGMKYEQYGFRRFPYELSHQLRLGIATLPGKLRADWTGDFYAPLEPAKLTLYAMASQVEVQNFFGIGNESGYNESLDRARYYKIEQNQFLFRTTVDTKVEVSTRLLVSAGLKIVDNTPLAASLLDSLRPYGSARNFSITHIGLQFLHETRNDQLFPSSGWYGVAGISYYPELFTNSTSFIRTRAELRLYTGISSSILALRGIAESISGTHPFFESAFVGGPNSLRGYEVQRFTGDAAVSGSAELRLPVAQYLLLVPQWFGLSAFAEAGRVFVNGENSSAIHSAIGAGVWFSFIKREYVGSFSIARSDEKFFFYGSIGFGF